MLIGELAKQSGCKVETVHYYERVGLLPLPDRTAGNYRVYDESHLERLRFIRTCRAIDMSLDDVRRLLYFRDRPDLACHEINELLDTHIAHLDEQVSELRGLQKYLRELRTCCDSPRTAGDCGILAALDSAAGQTRP